MKSADIFRISDDNSTFNPFGIVSLRENPFPALRDNTELYVDHAEKEFDKIEDWIGEVRRTTTQWRVVDSPVPPLALTGPSGSGKTYVLEWICESQDPETTPVLRKDIVSGMADAANFSEVLLRNLPRVDGDVKWREISLLRAVIEGARDLGAERILEIVKRDSPVAEPLVRAAVGDIDADYAEFLHRWLLHAPVSNSALRMMGVPDEVGEEKTVIRAVADIIRVARSLKLLQLWVVAFDGLEELRRPGRDQSSRRANFLCGLSHLIEQSMGGAPVAVVLTWRRDTEADYFGEFLRSFYPELWKNLQVIAVFPEMTIFHVWPFARMYLDRASIGSNTDFARAMNGAVKSVAEEARREAEKEGCPVTPAFVLRAWRREAFVAVMTKFNI